MWFLKKKRIRQNAGEKWKEKQGKGITDKREERQRVTNLEKDKKKTEWKEKWGKNRNQRKTQNQASSLNFSFSIMPLIC